MKKKFIKKAFTLVELIVVISIGGILLAISTNWYMSNVVASNVKNNRVVDLQSGVKTSMDMVKNTLKNTTQVHLVGKNVYDPDLTLEQLKTKNLDTNYNYIALSKDSNGNYSLINLLYNKEKKEFESFPISAEIRNDNLDKNTLSYSMSFYKGDSDYKKKLNKNLLHITISGNIHDVDDKEGKKGKTFELSENIDLQNVNQILVSKHLQGGIENVTAIAYDNAKIESEKEGINVKKMAFVFAIDDSYSMLFPIKSGDTHFKKSLAYKSTIEFLKQLDDLGNSSGISIDAYVYTWGENTLYDIKKGATGENDKYIYSLDKLKSVGNYGPHKLGKGASDRVEVKTQLEKNTINTLKRRFGVRDNPSEELKKTWEKFSNTLLPKGILQHLNKKSHCNLANTGKDDCISGTNTGLALLQSFEILNQLRENKNLSYDKQFLIMLTDGDPSIFSIQKHKITNRSGRLKYDFDFPYNLYKGLITDAKTFYNNKKDYYGNIRRQIPGTNFYSKILYPEMELLDYYSESEGKTIGKNLFPILYVKKVTQSKTLNKDDTFDKAYLIGFSAKSLNGKPTKEEKMFGVNSTHFYCKYSTINYKGYEQWHINERDEYGSIAKYLSERKEGMVEVHQATDGASLETAFSNIVTSIGNIMGAFDGPSPLTK